MNHVLLVVGTRPNFMKAAPVYHELVKRTNLAVDLVHTGQHYDANMSDMFLQQLNLDSNMQYLDVDLSDTTQNSQLALIMLALELFIINKNYKYSLVVVFGDVTSTLAAALTANKLSIKLAHIESGNRSFDRGMPEEINRILVDQISDYLFVAEPNGLENLPKEGVNGEIIYVGNSMIDTLFKLKDEAAKLTTYQDLGLVSGEYVLVTLHRPHNVDNLENLQLILGALTNISEKYWVVFPVHPRRKEQIIKLINTNTTNTTNRVKLIDPQGYLEFLNLNMNCAVVVTDSGGLQEETTALGVKCITLRPNTERPITCTLGTNKLIKILDAYIICNEVDNAIKDKIPDNPVSIDLWDGRAGCRIADKISQILK